MKRIIVLGTGFAAFSFLKKINLRLYDVTVISPRNHFLFTPLLPETTVGTIEFRSIIEPVRNLKKIFFHQAYCISIDADAKSVTCFDIDTRKTFELKYDMLVIAVGEVTNTYGVEGVELFSMFLKELSDARKIRTKVIDAFEKASLPDVSEKQKKKYLTFVVCGGGPTGVEFAAELHDFIEEDIKKKYPELKNMVGIILIEAADKILPSFDARLSEYTMKNFMRNKIITKTQSMITRISNDKIFLNDGSEIDYGLLVWATGNTSTNLVNNLSVNKNNRHKLVTNGHFEVSGCEDIYAIGDCCEIENHPFPATAQVAEQEGFYLAKILNKPEKDMKPFSFRNLGMLAYIGGYRALADMPKFKGSGFTTFLFWRSAYLTKLVSLKNKMLVLFDWFKTLVFGRDVSSF